MDSFIRFKSNIMRLDVKIHDAWRRWSHYIIRYIVPNDDQSILQFCEAFDGKFVDGSGELPGLDEFCDAGETVETVEYFTDRNLIGKAKDGKTIIAVRFYYTKTREG